MVALLLLLFCYSKMLTGV